MLEGIQGLIARIVININRKSIIVSGEDMKQNKVSQGSFRPLKDAS